MTTDPTAQSGKGASRTLCDLGRLHAAGVCSCFERNRPIIPTAQSTPTPAMAALEAYRFAQAMAVTEKARGNEGAERAWLDLLHLLDQAAATLAPKPAAAATPEGGEACRACQGPMTTADLKPGDDLPLCTRHWNWWLAQFVGTDDLPPCAAHLIREESA
jgi:hypothetical protein